jgi:hypothetical protein
MVLMLISGYFLYNSAGLNPRAKIAKPLRGYISRSASP